MHVEGLLRVAVGKSGDACHLGGKAEILKRIELVYDQCIDSQFLPGDGSFVVAANGPIIFLELGLKCFCLPFELFD